MNGNCMCLTVKNPLYIHKLPSKYFFCQSWYILSPPPCHEGPLFCAFLFANEKSRVSKFLKNSLVITSTSYQQQAEEFSLSYWWFFSLFAPSFLNFSQIFVIKINTLLWPKPGSPNGASFLCPTQGRWQGKQFTKSKIAVAYKLYPISDGNVIVPSVQGFAFPKCLRNSIEDGCVLCRYCSKHWSSLLITTRKIPQWRRKTSTQGSLINMVHF